jgi:hypothetical protein
MTPHAKYDTACTIDERFDCPWQPLKGKDIKNISSRTVLPHHYKYINLKGLYVTKKSLRSENPSYLCEIEAEFKKASHESVVQGVPVLFDEKKRRSKILCHCPFNS